MSVPSLSINASSRFAEEAVICAIYCGGDTLSQLRTFLTPSEFLDGRLGRIYLAALAVADRGLATDPLTIGDELGRHGHLDQVGGLEYLCALIDAVPTPTNAIAHGRIVVEHARARAVAMLLEESSLLLSEGTHQLPSVVARLRDCLDAHSCRDRAHSPRVLDDAEIEQLPRLEYLVDGMIPLGAAAVIHGQPGIGKTFVALDLALSIAAGIPFHGHQVQRGAVAFVAGEGFGGLGPRVRAFKKHHGLVGLLGVSFHEGAVNLLEYGAVSAFLRLIEHRTPKLVIFDTLHRNMAGGDDSSSQDMGKAVASVDRIRSALGAAVLCLHHVTLGTDRERGSGALRGAMDVMMPLKRDGKRIILSCDKHKDDLPFTPISFLMEERADSCVMVTAEDRAGVGAPTLTEAQLSALSSLQSLRDPAVATATEWLTESHLPQTTFYEARKVLLELGLARVSGARKKARYSISQSGSTLLTTFIRSDFSVDTGVANP